MLGPYLPAQRNRSLTIDPVDMPVTSVSSSSSTRPLLGVVPQLPHFQCLLEIFEATTGQRLFLDLSTSFRTSPPPDLLDLLHPPWGLDHHHNFLISILLSTSGRRSTLRYSRRMDETEHPQFWQISTTCLCMVGAPVFIIKGDLSSFTCRNLMRVPKYY